MTATDAFIANAAYALALSEVDAAAASLFSFHYDPSFELALTVIYDPSPTMPSGAKGYFPIENGLTAAILAAAKEATND